jgi:hypothetical protein
VDLSSSSRIEDASSGGHATPAGRDLNVTSLRPGAAQFLTIFVLLAYIPISELIFRCHWEWSEPRQEWIRIFSVKSDANSSGEESRSETETRSETEGRSATSVIWHDDHFRDFISKANSTSLTQSISPDPGARESVFSLHPLIRGWLHLWNKGQQQQLFSNECIAIIVNLI